LKFELEAIIKKHEQNPTKKPMNKEPLFERRVREITGTEDQKREPEYSVALKFELEAIMKKRERSPSKKLMKEDSTSEFKRNDSASRRPESGHKFFKGDKSPGLNAFASKMLEPKNVRAGLKSILTGRE
jgi:hypothetical protein